MSTTPVARVTAAWLDNHATIARPPDTKKAEHKPGR